VLKTARYAATPHTKVRNHRIPIEVIEHLAGDRSDGALDGSLCLFEVIVISHGANPQPLAPIMARPASGGEVFFGKKIAPDYPESFAAGEYLLVQITKL
jgi:hypothetical protein